MKGDRFLLAILVGIIALVILALALFYSRQGDQEYAAEDVPQGVIRNYALALQSGDYERAYAYLAEGEDKPSYDRFQNDQLLRKQESEQLSLQLGEVEQTGEKAVVSLVIIHPSGGPFADVWRESTSAVLTRDSSGAWKIVSMPYPYWEPAWYLSKIPRP